jgi:hypothetical protein
MKRIYFLCRPNWNRWNLCQSRNVSESRTHVSTGIRRVGPIAAQSVLAGFCAGPVDGPMARARGRGRRPMASLSEIRTPPYVQEIRIPHARAPRHGSDHPDRGRATGPPWVRACVRAAAAAAATATATARVQAASDDGGGVDGRGRGRGRRWGAEVEYQTPKMVVLVAAVAAAAAAAGRLWAGVTAWMAAEPGPACVGSGGGGRRPCWAEWQGGWLH